MQFQYPYFLLALFAIAIPIVIHLFNFRRFRKVYFSNVAFLKEVKVETQRRQKIRRWLVLLSRILAISALVMAFAQPYIPGTNASFDPSSGRAISIFIDNSFSMDAQQKDGRLLDVALTYADEILASCSDADKVQILTQDFESRHQVFYAPSEARNLLNEIKLSPQSHPLSDVIRRQSDLLLKQPEGLNKIYILSDFQKSFTNLSSVKPDSSLHIQFIPITPNTQNNLFIDSAWLNQPALHLGGTVTILIRVRNISDNAYENLPMRVEVNGKQKAPVLFNISADAATEVSLTYTIQELGFHEFRIELDDDQITFDDAFYFTFNVRDKIPIYLVEGTQSAPFIQRLFSGDNYFDLTTVREGQIDYARFATDNLIILNGVKTFGTGLTNEALKFMNNGGTLLIIPPADLNEMSYQQFASQLHIGFYQGIDTADTKIDRIHAADPFYADVFESIPENMDLPKVLKHRIISTQSSLYALPLLRLKNGRPFYMRYRPDKGQAYMLAVALTEEWSNFPMHALFVPTLLKTAFSSVQQSPLYYILGDNQPIGLKNVVIQRDKVLVIRNADLSFEMIPQQQTIETTSFLFMNHQMQDAGFYSVYDGKDVIHRFAANYNRQESHPAVWEYNALSQLINEAGLTGVSLIETGSQPLNKQIIESGLGIRLWKLFIVFALIFTGIEILLIRFLKG